MKNDDRFLYRALTWVYQILFFVTPLVFTWFNEELFEFNKMIFVYGISTLAGSLWLIRMIWQKKFQWQRTIFDIPLAIFLFSQLLSTLFSIHLRTSIFGYYTRFHGGLLSTIAYMILFAVYVQTFSSKDISKFVKSLAIGCLIVSLIAIPEHFGRSFSCLLINSSQLLETQSVATTFTPAQIWTSYNASCWIQDVQHRVFATFGQPNWLAAYVITLLPLFMVFTSLGKKRDHLFFGVVSIAGFLSLLFTRSRSGILGWGVEVGWIVLFLASWWMFSQRNTNKTAQSFLSEQRQLLRQLAQSLGLVSAALIVCVVFFGTPYTPGIESRLTVQPAQPIAETQPVSNRLEEGGTDSGQIRVIVWEGAIKVWRRYPIFGSGVETFAYSYYKDRPEAHNLVSEWDFLYNKAHNEFLNYLATTGLAGLLSYLFLLGMMIGFPVYAIFMTKKATAEDVLLLAAISSGLVGLTVSNFFGFSTVMVGVLFFIFPAMSWHVVQGRNAEATVKDTVKVASTELELRQIVWSVLAAITLCIVWIMIWRTWRADYFFALGKHLNQKQQYSAGVGALEKAYILSNGEGVFAEELAEMYSWISAGFYDTQQATAAAAFREASFVKLEESLAENPYNLNFYKTKARVLATLSPQEPQALVEAQKTLEKALELAPTDPRVRYNLGLVKLSLNATASAQKDIEQSVQMRPNFEDPRMTLGKIYTDQGEYQKAIDQYTFILERIQPRNAQAKNEVSRLEMLIASGSGKTQPNSNQPKPPAGARSR